MAKLLQDRPETPRRRRFEAGSALAAAIRICSPQRLLSGKSALDRSRCARHIGCSQAAHGFADGGVKARVHG
ncbi:hypothetical protein [Bosea sp. NBC_00550]|jgi:hypothetical protein|uniref:hypothetical protein n=1 Tax=Bosea sp. NBC_00550 TaxID=2969621 RepID=UPI00222FA4EF|nr:hypothetical protein [Bosea sp. NBC_00550]UZF91085.1 hypothetical protein NWE53_18330 [Bosea sp. NBC_00550]